MDSTPARAVAFLAPIAGLLAATLAAQEPVMFRAGPDRAGVYADPGPGPGFTVRWRITTDGTVRSTPAVTTATVYVGTSAGTLLAVDRSDGAIRWRYDAGSPLPSSPLVADGTVVIAARDGSVHAVEARTGRGRWTTRPTDELPLPWGREGWDYWVSSPAVVDGLVLIGTPDGRLAALDLATGAEQWARDLGARTRSSPAVVDGIVFIGDDAGIVHAVTLADGRPVWRHETEGATLSSAEFGWDRVSIRASPAVADGVVYIGSRDGGLYALDASDGRRLWYADHGAPWVVASAAVRDDRVWIGSSDGLFVAALDATTGAELWRTDVGARVFASPTLAGPDGGRTLFVADHGGAVRALDPATGDERWRFTVGPGVMVQSAPVPADDELYFGADDGAVYALGPAPAPPRLAVFWDSALAGQALRTPNAALLRDYLADHGYRVLDALALAEWVGARVEDRKRSVVVFALDVVPPPLRGDGGPGIDTGSSRAASGATGLIRYLQSGGKVVWAGFPPLALVRDSTGQPTAIDYDRTRSALGLDPSAGAQGRYGASPTTLGRAWGLADLHLSEAAVATGPGVRVLATDELDRAAAVVRDFGGPRGTGFVLLWGVGADRARLAEIRAAAEYGVLRAP